MQITCCDCDSVFSFCPTASAARPPMPISISSNTSVRGSAVLLRFAAAAAPSSTLTFSASITRLISPPDAISVSAFSGSPGFVAILHSARSHPYPVHASTSSRDVTTTSNRACIASSLICLSATFASFFAAAVRSVVSFRASTIYFAAASIRSFSNSTSRASRFSRSDNFPAASAPNAITSASVAPYLRFSLSSAASRSSISPNRSGDAVTFPAKFRNVAVASSTLAFAAANCCTVSRNCSSNRARSSTCRSAPPSNVSAETSASYSNSCAAVAAVNSRSEFASTRFSVSSRKSSSASRISAPSISFTWKLHKSISRSRSCSALRNSSICPASPRHFA